MPNWANIDTVLLDMDGTLLDLHFDNHFWLELIPQAYAKRHQISLAEAHDIMTHRYEEVQGQLQWYCLDYWQQELQLPIMELKREIQHLISIRDDAIVFLKALKAAGKELILLTNAHRDSLSLKVEMTELDQYLDLLISTHDYGVSKEEQSLWQQVQEDLRFDKERTLFVDDSAAVLASAKRFGIGHLLAVANPDSKQPSRQLAGYENITDYRDILPI
ncbi:GMP/IMP nucleotidase [Pseudoalteromonas sp. BDTF-M6]|uniref:GMP/IMP nucleotidase n=1 Tax=Pseudoalteromonas sp. BDTF-M6 TaxID=2796132 RepID=UPI001BAEBFFF|nr:GMP/IMP nucleotidase [Pseudoalteromonas sp. BDTF-M6]MBS3799206.1 GMP/IMP nucleotidase [Pseudoalteromonas sp. BDTF-M6]